MNGKKSDIRDVTCGVPQGSTLGPLLFILYIHDFAKVSDELFYVLFADDTNVFLNGKNINTLCATVQHELSVIYLVTCKQIDIKRIKISLYGIP